MSILSVRPFVHQSFFRGHMSIIFVRYVSFLVVHSFIHSLQNEDASSLINYASASSFFYPHIRIHHVIHSTLPKKKLDQSRLTNITDMEQRNEGSRDQSFPIHFIAILLLTQKEQYNRHHLLHQLLLFTNHTSIFIVTLREPEQLTRTHQQMHEYYHLEKKQSVHTFRI